LKAEQTLRPPPAATFDRLRVGTWLWSVLILLAPFALAFAVYLTVFLVMRPATTGDEPHYLITAESIAYDGDVDLTNDYASRDRTLKVVNVFPLDTNLQAADYTHSGKVRPLHGVGLSAYLAPFVALGGLTGARIGMLLIAALLADQLYRLLRDLRFPWLYRNLAWIAAAFCLPVLVFTNQIYPELPGALLLLVALRILIRGARSPAALALGSAAAAALVWLHVRYLSLSIAVIVGLAFAACYELRRDAVRRDPGHRAPRNLLNRIRYAGTEVTQGVVSGVRHWRTVALPLVVPYAFGLGLLALCFQRWYGSPLPGASYAAFSTSSVGSAGWNFIYTFVLRDILDPVDGWIPFAPVHWIGFAALGCLVVRFGWRAAAGLAVAVGYELLVASVGPSVGWGFPARYPMIVIPLIAIPLAVAIQELRAARFIFWPLLTISLVFAWAAVRNYQGLYPASQTQPIFGLRSTAPAFPITILAPTTTSYALAPGEPPPVTGRVAGHEVVATAGRDGPGYVLYGPANTRLPAGVYTATYHLAGSGHDPSQPIATLDAIDSPFGPILASKVLTVRDIAGRHPKSVTLQFATNGANNIETRLYYQGAGTLRAGEVDVSPKVALLPPPSTFPDWPLAFLWVAGTAFIGWLFVQVMQLSRRRASDVPTS
jgi:hypothetical protein